MRFQLSDNGVPEVVVEAQAGEEIGDLEVVRVAVGEFDRGADFADEIVGNLQRRRRSEG